MLYAIMTMGAHSRLNYTQEGIVILINLLNCNLDNDK